VTILYLSNLAGEDV